MSTIEPSYDRYTCMIIIFRKIKFVLICNYKSSDQLIRVLRSINQLLSHITAAKLVEKFKELTNATMNAYIR